MKAGKVYNSPITYPGGKRWLFQTFLSYLPPGTQELVSPFFGGAAMELNLAARGVKVYGYDICPHLVNFWQHWLERSERFQVDAIALLDTQTPDGIREMKSEFLRCQSDTRGAKGYENAVRYYLLSRLSIFGMTLSSEHVIPYQKVDGTYRDFGRRRGIFPKVNQFPERQTFTASVSVSDFRKTLAQHPDIFAYLDPPYPNTTGVYALEAFAHEALALLLSQRKNWILSYSDTPSVREMYADFKKIELQKRSGFRKGGQAKVMKELLIFSEDIAERRDGGT